MQVIVGIIFVGQKVLPGFDTKKEPFGQTCDLGGRSVLLIPSRNIHLNGQLLVSNDSRCRARLRSVREGRRFE